MADEFMETVVLFVLGPLIFIALWPSWLFYTGRNEVRDAIVLYANLIYLIILSSLSIFFIFFT